MGVTLLVVLRGSFQVGQEVIGGDCFQATHDEMLPGGFVGQRQQFVNNTIERWRFLSAGYVTPR